jgi:head-tail adaptor
MAARIGALRQRVILRAPVETVDDIGGLERSFQAIATVYAALDLISGAEEPVDERKGQRLRFRLTLRWRADLQAGWQAMLGARSFNLLTVADSDGRRRFLTCEAEEITP